MGHRGAHGTAGHAEHRPHEREQGIHEMDAGATYKERINLEDTHDTQTNLFNVESPNRGDDIADRGHTVGEEGALHIEANDGDHVGGTLEDELLNIVGAGDEIALSTVGLEGSFRVFLTLLTFPTLLTGITILATAMLVCLVTTRRLGKYLSSTSIVGTDPSHQQGAPTSTGTLDNINLKIIRMDQLLPDKEKDPHPDGPDVTQAEVREMHGVAPEIEANLIHTNPNQLPPRDPHQVEQVIVTTRQLGEYPSPTSGVVADPSTGAHSRGVHGAFPPLLGSSIILLTVVRACLVLATTRQISQQVSETDPSHQHNHVTCAHHRGAHGATCQTLSCGEDIIIVKCDLIYLTVKGVLEKEDSYDDMHGLSHPSHANDAADQSNNVGNFHPEILKHEWKI